MNIQCQRLSQDIKEISKYGESKKGISRLVFTNEERSALRYIRDSMVSIGMTTRIDEVGNLIGRLEGHKPDLPAIIMGSHIDTVINGGKYDGVIGVIGGIEVVRSIVEEKGKLYHPVEVIVFVGEEGSRFPGYMLGSHAFSHGLTPDASDNVFDDKGISLREAINSIGLDPSLIANSKRNPKTIKAFIELHIEQGSILENKGMSVGIVTGTAGPIFAKCAILGRADHAGTTPMKFRKDALVTAAEIIILVEKIVKDYGGEHTVATVGSIKAEPNSTNVIAGKVLLSFDIRDVDLNSRNLVFEKIVLTINDVCNKRGVENQFWIDEESKPRVFSSSIIEILKKSCKKLDLPIYELISGAAHDAMNMSDITEVGMIFVRSKNGVSHSPDEYSTIEDIAIGVNVMRQVIFELDSV